MLKFILGYFIVVACCGCAVKLDQPCNNKGRRNSFLWKIKRNPPAYFFGTIHVPYTRVWSHIPTFSKRAFRSSENVFFELDLTNDDTRASLSRCQMLPGGTDLREILPSDLYQRLKSHLDYVRRAMPGWLTSEQAGNGWYADNLFDAIAGNWERKRPVWVMLMVNSLTEADIRTQGIPVLDLHLAHEAGRLGKNVGAVEEVDEQCKPLNGLNLTQVLFALNHTLLMQERLRFGTVAPPYTTDDLIHQYNCGDLNSSIFDSDSSQFPKLVNDTDLEGETESREAKEMADNVDYYFKKELIYRRNERMAHRVKTLLKQHSDESFFFAFGAGHFLGNGSVIDFLRKDGFEIEHWEDDVTNRGNGDDFPDLTRKIGARSANKRQVKRTGATLRKTDKEQKRRRRQRRRHSDKNGRRKKEVRKEKRGKSNRSSSRLDLSSYEISQTDEEVYQQDISPVRVINRYPTVSPALHDIWRNDKISRRSHQYPNNQPQPSYTAWGTQRKDSSFYRSVVTSKSQALDIEVWAERYQKMLDAQNASSSVQVSYLLVSLLLAAAVIMSPIFATLW
uniref:Metalloprotease TIKI n=1 Tax=Phallusia mammillata TaxID=59560 RepID=A0A6F9DUS8_9ASCI|nr:metalloprotease TIKI1 [Phallusia mammillata]